MPEIGHQSRKIQYGNISACLEAVDRRDPHARALGQVLMLHIGRQAQFLETPRNRLQLLDGRFEQKLVGAIPKNCRALLKSHNEANEDVGAPAELGYPSSN